MASVMASRALALAIAAASPRLPLRRLMADRLAKPMTSSVSSAIIVSVATNAKAAAAFFRERGGTVMGIQAQVRRIANLTGPALQDHGNGA